MNKKGDIESMIYVIIVIFVLGVLLFFMNHVTDALYTQFDEYFNSTEKYNESEARTSLSNIHDVENSAWDFAFTFIALGLFLVLGMTAFSTRISPIFYWIYGLLALIFLGLAVVLSTVWQNMVQNPEFVDTLARFPITHLLLGTYYPTFITGVVVVSMILLFGKPPGSETI